MLLYTASLICFTYTLYFPSCWLVVRAHGKHEVRSPLNGILGMAELLQREERDPDRLEMISTVVDCGRSLLVIINDLLDFSKVC